MSNGSKIPVTDIQFSVDVKLLIDGILLKIQYNIEEFSSYFVHMKWTFYILNERGYVCLRTRLYTDKDSFLSTPTNAEQKIKKNY